jgi:hypothetical protein
MTVEPGRHQRVLGAHDRRLVHEEVARAQAVARLDPVDARRSDRRAERPERIQVWVETPAADHVSAGRRDHGAPETRQQWPGDQERCANPLGLLDRDLRVGIDVRRAQRDHVVIAPVDVDAQLLEQPEHRLDVADARDVAQHDLILGEQAGGQGRQRGILVAGRKHRPRQGKSAFDEEFVHDPGGRVPKG